MKNLFKNIEKHKDVIFCIVAMLLIAIFAFSISPKQMQNDIFYTIKIGELIRKNGIDGIDHFSWHEGLPYTYPHWLYDVGMSFIYNAGGFEAIYISTIVLSILLGICVFFTNSKLTKNRLLSFIVTIAVLYLIKGYITARAQLVTFILFILLVYNIERFLENKKLINAIVLFFIHLIIANLHVAVWPFTFVLYLPYIAEYLIAEFLDILIYKKIQIIYLKYRHRVLLKKAKRKNLKNQEKINQKIGDYNEKLLKLQDRIQKVKTKREDEEKKEYKVTIKKNKNVRWLIIIMIIAVITGFLTPLGKTPFTYTYFTMKGNTTHNINEHLPLTLTNNIPMLCTMIVLIALIGFTRIKIRLSDLFMIGGLTYLMFYTRRQQSMLVLIGSIAFTRMLKNFFEILLNRPLDDMIKKCFNRFTAFILIAVMVSWSLHLYGKVKNAKFVNESTYPVKASEWILNNLNINSIRLYNEYNYGSYLLFKGIPVFIDSRADLYAPEFNTPSGKATDGNDIFMDFINSSNISTYYGDIFEKYSITHAILYKNSKIAMLIRKTDSERFKEIYSDDYFVIYEVLNL